MVFVCLSVCVFFGARISRGNIINLSVCSPFSAEFFEVEASLVAELNVGLLPWCQSEEMKILINNNGNINK